MIVAVIPLSNYHMTDPANIENEAGDSSMPRKYWGLFACLAAFVLIWLFWWPIWFVALGGRYIGNSPSGLSYSTTRFEFHYGHATRIVEDPHNKMQWVFGDYPDSISVVNGCRIVTCNRPARIFKSRGDSMDVQDDSVKHKGYMGIWSDATQFRIDKYGVVQE